jgi:DNA invertase Pin-like site-specific DNA recombinase
MHDLACSQQSDDEAMATMTEDTRPLAYGYVRLEDVDHEAAARHRQAIGRRCIQDGFRLISTFCDLDCDGTTLARSALTELLQALRVAPQAVVVVPDVTHLSPAESICGALLLLLHRSEHRLITLQEINGRVDGLGVIAHAASLDDGPNPEPSS